MGMENREEAEKQSGYLIQIGLTGYISYYKWETSFLSTVIICDTNHS
jgi:hypothetical protein